MNKSEILRITSSSVFEAMNSRDFTNFDLLLDDDATFDFPGAGKILGKRKIIIFLKALLRNYKHLDFSIHEIVTDLKEDKSCVVWSNFGEHINGNPYQNRGNTILHLKDDKIVFISDYFKDTSFVKPS